MTDMKVPHASAYGGCLIDEDGRVLLREPANHFGGYVWTFPKGRVDAGETPQQAALREVLEETGYTARITGLVPGVFKGDTTSTVFFLMAAVGEQRAFGWETTQTRWASLEDARTLIAQTTSLTGRTRDLAVIEAIQQMMSDPG